MKTSRKEVYTAIDQERDFQDNYRAHQKGGLEKNTASLPEEITLIDDYLNRASKAWAAKNNAEALANLRIVSALAVRAQETHGVVYRKKDTTK